jgi:2-iminobutanoate/2-iminopropanoate deaminase
MSKQVIKTDQAPNPVGPYSQGIIAKGKMIFVAGQVGLNPATGKLVEGGVQTQTQQALTNIKNILAAVGADLSHVVKTTVFLSTIADFKALNEVYATFFPENPPARSTFGGLELPAGALVEIECIAIIED